MEPTLWQDIVDRIAAAFPESCIFLNVQDNQSRRTQVPVTRGFDDSSVRDYCEHFGAINPYNSFWRNAGTMQAFTSDIATTSKVRKSEFYNDFLVRHDRAAGSGVKLFGEPDGHGALLSQYSATNAERYAPGMVWAFDRLAPFLKRAIDLNRRLMASDAVARTLGVALDALDLPALVVDSDARVRLSNAKAGALLAIGDMRTDREGRLRMQDAHADSRVRQSIAAVLSRRNAGSEFCIRTQDGLLWAVMTMLPIASDSLGGCANGWMSGQESLVLVVVRRLGADVPRESDLLLRDAFGLTQAEARLAARLASGMSLEDAALGLGVTKETARSQLKQVFAKTDMHRQPELVVLLARLGRI
jgi:DNA-binding CsgD family transcriptional regulator/PAS domain-containing protein